MGEAYKAPQRGGVGRQGWAGKRWGLGVGKGILRKRCRNRVWAHRGVGRKGWACGKRELKKVAQYASGVGRYGRANEETWDALLWWIMNKPRFSCSRNFVWTCLSTLKVLQLRASFLNILKYTYFWIYLHGRLESAIEHNNLGLI